MYDETRVERVNERNNDGDDSARAEDERRRMNQTQEWSQLEEETVRDEQIWR